MGNKVKRRELLKVYEVGNKNKDISKGKSKKKISKLKKLDKNYYINNR